MISFKKNLPLRFHSWRALLPLLILPLILNQTYPHVQSGLQYRVTNRKYISHLVFEQREGDNRITLVTTHFLYWAYKSDSHVLYYPCGDISHCVKEMIRLDRHLKEGWNIGLELEGGTVRELHYLKP